MATVCTTTLGSAPEGGPRASVHSSRARSHSPQPPHAPAAAAKPTASWVKPSSGISRRSRSEGRHARPPSAALAAALKAMASSLRAAPRASCRSGSTHCHRRPFCSALMPALHVISSGTTASERISEGTRRARAQRRPPVRALTTELKLMTSPERALHGRSLSSPREAPHRPARRQAPMAALWASTAGRSLSSRAPLSSPSARRQPRPPRSRLQAPKARLSAVRRLSHGG
mmetsp:Transcript_40657/g.121510  ORF Transcript_40657/g.121510 Transcript_40657/m.121510 type:complete len:230 (+) Transcript_40657:1150-1839(+)